MPKSGQVSLFAAENPFVPYKWMAFSNLSISGPIFLKNAFFTSAFYPIVVKGIYLVMKVLKMNKDEKRVYFTGSPFFMKSNTFSFSMELSSISCARAPTILTLALDNALSPYFFFTIK